MPTATAIRYQMPLVVRRFAFVLSALYFLIFFHPFVRSFVRSFIPLFPVLPRSRSGSLSHSLSYFKFVFCDYFMMRGLICCLWFAIFDDQVMKFSVCWTCLLSNAILNKYLSVC